MLSVKIGSVKCLKRNLELRETFGKTVASLIRNKVTLMKYSAIYMAHLFVKALMSIFENVTTKRATNFP